MVMQIAVVAALFDRGVDPGQLDCEGNTPLHLVSQCPFLSACHLRQAVRKGDRRILQLISDACIVHDRAHQKIGFSLLVCVCHSVG
jgi:hypothetical protein